MAGAFWLLGFNLKIGGGLCIRSGGNGLVSYLRYDGASLPCGVGKDGPNGSRMSDGRAGHLSYGPYFSLPPGKYVAGFYARLLPGSREGTVDLDVAIAGGTNLVHRTIPTRQLFEDTPSFVTVKFALDAPANGVEVRLFVHDGVLVELDELVVFSTRPRNWSGA